MILQNIRQKASQQHGVIGINQLEKLGATRNKINALVRQDVLIPSFGKTFVLAGSPVTPFQEISRATLMNPGRGVASHRTAAFLWDCWTPGTDENIEVILEGRSHHQRFPEVTVHSPRDSHNITPIRRHNIRTTISSRTIIDFAAVAPHALRSLAERMVFAGHITQERLIAAVAQHSKKGRAGIGEVRELLASWPFTGDIAESVLELRMQELLKNGPFAEFVSQLEIGPYRVDFAWPKWRIVLECDGWGKIDSVEYFAKAARRDSYLQLHGWLVLHFTWAEITRRPGMVLREIRQAFHHQGWRSS